MNEFNIYLKDIAQQLKKEEIKILYYLFKENAVTVQKGATNKELQEIIKASRFKMVSHLSILTALCYIKADKSEKEAKYYLSDWGLMFLGFYNKEYSAIINKKREE